MAANTNNLDVTAALTQCLSGKQDQRRQGEAAVARLALEQIDAYALALTRLLIHNDTALPSRQLAASQLALLELARLLPASRNAVKSVLLPAISVDWQSSPLRNAFCHVITKIAAIDYPDCWPELVPALLSHIGPQVRYASVLNFRARPMLYKLF
ncbi:MAG: hypothetical protein SGCHY_004635 [Lobulomycetales sp.]